MTQVITGTGAQVLSTGSSLVAAPPLSASGLELATMANLKSLLTIQNPQNTTSGTYVDFTGIPAGVRRLTVWLYGVSTNGSSNLQIQLGSGAIQTTGYVSGAGGGTPATISTGHLIYGGGSASTSFIGAVTFHLVSGTSWLGSGSVATNSASQGAASGSTVGLTGTLDRLRLTTVNGTDVFDGGSVNILMEF